MLRHVLCFKPSFSPNATFLLIVRYDTSYFDTYKCVLKSGGRQIEGALNKRNTYGINNSNSNSLVDHKPKKNMNCNSLLMEGKVKIQVKLPATFRHFS